MPANRFWGALSDGGQAGVKLEPNVNVKQAHAWPFSDRLTRDL